MKTLSFLYQVVRCLEGHAMLLTGFNNETRLFTVLNSWGANWWDNGKCYTHYFHILNPNYTWEFLMITKVE